MLGRDPTLPHYRPSVPASARLEDKFPIWYFFYGTLASPERLSRLLDVDLAQLPELKAATLLDGKIQTWAGKYRALMDSVGGKVEGWIYPVICEDQEDALRVYEGDSYEVVRARFVSDGKVIEGRTFRFAGFEDELTEDELAYPR
ncbi:uncharacterized protein EI97DRAFT_19540 [Westerdykella ornata]|uniref:Putative gamma-glutamylcyclotransferase n=1 Tax=Westerdykella ornata TaxID=318751 RepID=A0A6A6JWT7_WESOR|nr:uncharacterized protein EI97DRAFT_19540 [Westerdykella ornata]KAF2281072.1 hypothetical protein EI97DRAFT_19540 [Westerdykella ornata]